MRRLLFAVLLTAAACSSRPAPSPSPSPSPSPTPQPTPERSSAGPATPSPTGRVAVIVMENHSYDTIIGNAAAPYLNGLAKRSALATNYVAVSHPSLPNYLALIGGDTFGVRSDCTDCYVGAPNLVDAAEGRRLSWKAYMEGMPRPCFAGGSSGRYAKKHNPFMYFDDIRTNRSRCRNVVPLSSIDDAHLPDFTWITPDLCNDIHDCSVATGDAFLRRTVPPLLRGLGPRGVLFITFDEGTSDQHVATILAGDGVRPGRYKQAFDHYSLLRTIEERLGVPLTGRAASAMSMQPLLR